MSSSSSSSSSGEEGEGSSGTGYSFADEMANVVIEPLNFGSRESKESRAYPDVGGGPSFTYEDPRWSKPIPRMPRGGDGSGDGGGDPKLGTWGASDTSSLLTPRRSSTKTGQIHATGRGLPPAPEGAITTIVTVDLQRYEKLQAQGLRPDQMIAPLGSEADQFILPGDLLWGVIKKGQAWRGLSQFHMSDMEGFNNLNGVRKGTRLVFLGAALNKTEKSTKGGDIKYQAMGVQFGGKIGTINNGWVHIKTNQRVAALSRPLCEKNSRGDLIQKVIRGDHTPTQMIPELVVYDDTQAAALALELSDLVMRTMQKVAHDNSEYNNPDPIGRFEELVRRGNEAVDNRFKEDDFHDVQQPIQLYGYYKVLATAMRMCLLTFMLHLKTAATPSIVRNAQVKYDTLWKMERELGESELESMNPLRGVSSAGESVTMSELLEDTSLEADKGKRVNKEVAIWSLWLPHVIENHLITCVSDQQSFFERHIIGYANSDSPPGAALELVLGYKK
jgi:hypothetical protein